MLAGSGHPFIRFSTDSVFHIRCGVAKDPVDELEVRLNCGFVLTINCCLSDTD